MRRCLVMYIDNCTLVTGISKKYLEKAKLTIPTWRIKEQIKNLPLIVFYDGLTPKDLKFVSDLWSKDVQFVNWNMNEYENTRELMLSAFVLGVKYIQTDRYIKLDCDAYFEDGKDIFREDDLDYDLYSRAWGYTKPGNWINTLDKWATENNLGGSDMADYEITDNTFKSPRICSTICYHKTQFVRDVVEYCPERLPVPSHDTYLWYMAERLPQYSWGSDNLMRYGIGTKATMKGLEESIDKFDVRKTKNRQRLAKKYYYGYEHNLYNKVQIEITALCNLSCPNCDRSCGQQQAPSSQHMTLQQIKEFVEESIDLNWQWDRIDVIGGEPTLHPQLMEIFEELKRYKDLKPKTTVRITTNGKGNKVKSVIEEIPKWVKIKNTDKEHNHISEDGGFTAYHSAPIDSGIEDAPMCDIPWRCGLGMTPNGYYACGAGGGIDRVFKFGVGIKSLKDLNAENLKDQTELLCKFCGHSPTASRHRTSVQETSETWKKAFDSYK